MYYTKLSRSFCSWLYKALLIIFSHWCSGGRCGSLASRSYDYFFLFLGVCTEFNVAGGVIQGQIKAKCNEKFPKCIQLYNSTDAYKCKYNKTLNVFGLINFYVSIDFDSNFVLQKWILKNEVKFVPGWISRAMHMHTNLRKKNSFLNIL